MDSTNGTGRDFLLEHTLRSGNNITENMTTYLNRSNCSNDYCVSDDEYVDLILDYIYPSLSEWILISLYIVVFLAGLIGNFLVCFAVWRNHSMRTVTNFFIVNLALADFSVGLFCLPPTLLSDITETWYMGSVMCKLAKYLQVGHNVFNGYLYSLLCCGAVTFSTDVYWAKRLGQG